MEGEHTQSQPQEPRPVIGVDYPLARALHQSRAIVASIGVLAIVFGAIGIALLPFGLLYLTRLQASNPLTKTFWFLFHRYVSVVMSLSLGIWAIAAGTACLRRAPVGRMLIIGWAWARVVWFIYAVAVDGWYGVF